MLRYYEPKHDVTEFFCVSLYTDYLSDFHKMFQVAFACDTHLENQIWSFYYKLFLNYADNRHTWRPAAKM